MCCSSIHEFHIYVILYTRCMVYGGCCYFYWEVLRFISSLCVVLFCVHKYFWFCFFVWRVFFFIPARVDFLFIRSHMSSAIPFTWVFFFSFVCSFFLSSDFFSLHIGVLRTVRLNFYPQRPHSNIILHATIATLFTHSFTNINRQWHEAFRSNEIRWWWRRRRTKNGRR